MFILSALITCAGVSVVRLTRCKCMCSSESFFADMYAGLALLNHPVYAAMALGCCMLPATLVSGPGRQVSVVRLTTLCWSTCCQVHMCMLQESVCLLGCCLLTSILTLFCGIATARLHGHVQCVIALWATLYADAFSCPYPPAHVCVCVCVYDHCL